MGLKNKKTAIISHPWWGRGGAEISAMWILEALILDFEVTLVTRGGFDIDALNALSGTSLSLNSFNLIVLDTGSSLVPGSLQHIIYCRKVANLGKSFHLRVTASGTLNWKKPAIHFLSSIMWNPYLVKQALADKALPKMTLRQTVTTTTMHFFANPHPTPISQQTFIANSNWTAEVSKPYMQKKAKVIYPAVPVLNLTTPWEVRTNDALIFGRISPEKKIENAIQIVQIARDNGYDGKLLIVGPAGDAQYYQYIKNLVSKRLDWVELKPSVQDEAKTRLLNSVRYGLNACDVEAFGISTVEMSMAGIITLIPENSGQSEIILDKQLRYSTLEEASKKLCEIAKATDLQNDLHKACLKRGLSFRPELFISQVRDLTQKSANYLIENE